MPRFQIENISANSQQLFPISKQSFSVGSGARIDIDTADFYEHEIKRLANYFSFKEIAEKEKSKKSSHNG